MSPRNWQYGLNCLNSAGFSSANNLTTYPNQRRNSFRGPGFFDSDLSVNKNFKLTERLAFGVGANLYNVFNHPNFASPIDTFSAGDFGQVTETTAPPTGPYGAFFTGLPSGRIIQFQRQTGVLVWHKLKPCGGSLREKSRRCFLLDAATDFCISRSRDTACPNTSF